MLGQLLGKLSVGCIHGHSLGGGGVGRRDCARARRPDPADVGADCGFGCSHGRNLGGCGVGRLDCARARHPDPADVGADCGFGCSDALHGVESGLAVATDTGQCTLPCKRRVELGHTEHHGDEDHTHTHNPRKSRHRSALFACCTVECGGGQERVAGQGVGRYARRTHVRWCKREKQNDVEYDRRARSKR